MRTLFTLVLLFALSPLSFASHHRSRKTAQGGEAGRFDFYLFVLSWSPEFCYSHRSAPECADHRGFVVHGLWPQNSDGTYPENCRTTQPPPTHFDAIGDIMPREIIEHEWRTHGTCSGLSGDAYFSLIRALHDSIRIPSRLEAPSSSFSLNGHELKREIEQSNGSLSDENLAIQLRGRYLNAVEVCLAKDTHPTPVPCSGIRDAGNGTFLVPPVR